MDGPENSREERKEEYDDNWVRKEKYSSGCHQVIFTMLTFIFLLDLSFEEKISMHWWLAEGGSG